MSKFLYRSKIVFFLLTAPVSVFFLILWEAMKEWPAAMRHIYNPRLVVAAFKNGAPIDRAPAVDDDEAAAQIAALIQAMRDARKDFTQEEGKAE